MDTPAHRTGHDSSRYAIRLAGHLPPRWAPRFDGMTLTRRDDGTTVLEGHVADQAGLHGLLRTLRDLGLPLVSLTSDRRARAHHQPRQHPDRRLT